MLLDEDWRDDNCEAECPRVGDTETSAPIWSSAGTSAVAAGEIEARIVSTTTVTVVGHQGQPPDGG